MKPCVSSYMTPLPFWRGPEGECGQIRADRLRERKREECELHKHALEGKLKNQELEYATSFFEKFRMPLLEDLFTFEEPHVRQSIFAPAQQNSWFAQLRPIPIRPTHPRKNEPPLTAVTCEVLNTKDFEVFYKHVVPLLDFERPALEDPWPASRWGHPISEDSRNMTLLTHKEIRDHFQAKICREERMAPDHMLGMRAGLAPPPPSVADH